MLRIPRNSYVSDPKLSVKSGWDSLYINRSFWSRRVGKSVVPFVVHSMHSFGFILRSVFSPGWVLHENVYFDDRKLGQQGNLCSPILNFFGKELRYVGKKKRSLWKFKKTGKDFVSFWFLSDVCDFPYQWRLIWKRRPLGKGWEAMLTSVAPYLDRTEYVVKNGNVSSTSGIKWK